jgi:hypothetical protein
VALTLMEFNRRTATPSELTQKYDNLYWYNWKSRRVARSEAAAGVVEEVSCRVIRAWKLFSCDGSPCCPNDWLIETGTHEYIVAESWRDLQPSGGNAFPGQNLYLVRWPKSHRLLRAEVSGSPTLATDLPIQNLVLLPDHWLRCEVLDPAQIPPEIKAALTAS